ncbi:unnamed protein product [Paramecium sonneborni]|uniref:Mini antigen n=1 Tax=Paramecium sonneborni TaxID=65129 RepID=A0A8S1RHD9_9CILI|nr:unnamed protein product [Paramecium sonneborni]
MMNQVFWLSVLVFSMNCNTIISIDRSCVCKQLNLFFECASNWNCVWNNNTNSCEQKECSSIKDQQICLYSQSCQYRNGKCEYFTKCEDLKGKTISECYQMSLNCRESNGEHCLPHDFEGRCDKFINEGECDKDVDCLWKDSKCILWNNCQQAKQKTLCQRQPYTCDWSETLNICKQQECTKYDNQNTCQIVLLDPNSHFFKICTWNHTQNQCEESRPDALPSDTCATNTFFTYHWSSTKISGYCQQCLSPSVQKPSHKHCLCKSISTQLDCQQNQTCTWKEGSCQENNCSEIDSPQACIELDHCAWFANVCIEFTQCENYKAFSNLECQSINKKCLLSDKLEMCTSKYLECNEHKTDDKCNGSKNSKQELCYWDEKINTCQVWTECSQQQSATYCEFSGACVWNGKCQQIWCSLLNEQQCNHYLTAPNSKEWNYCMLYGDTCQNLKSQNLSRQECYALTYGISTWTSSGCQLCEFPDDNYTKILTYIGLIISML